MKWIFGYLFMMRCACFFSLINVLSAVVIPRRQYTHSIYDIVWNRILFFCTNAKTRLFRLTFEYHLLCICGSHKPYDGCEFVFLFSHWMNMNVVSAVFVCMRFIMVFYICLLNFELRIGNFNALWITHGDA